MSPFSSKKVYGGETPDTKAPGIGMAFLQMIHVHHHRQPDLAALPLRGLTTTRPKVGISAGSWVHFLMLCTLDVGGEAQHGPLAWINRAGFSFVCLLASRWILGYHLGTVVLLLVW